MISPDYCMWGKALLRKAAGLLLLLGPALLKGVIPPHPVSPSGDPAALLNP